MASPVNTVCLLQSLRASQRPIKAADLLYTFRFACASSKVTPPLPRSEHTTLSLRLDTVSTLPSPSAAYLESAGVALHEAVSLI